MKTIRSTIFLFSRLNQYLKMTQFSRMALFLILAGHTLYMNGQGVRFGIFIDPQVSWMASDNKVVQNDGSRIGLNFGLEVHKYFADNYSFTTGVSLNNQGGKLTYDDPLPFRIQDQTDTLEAGTTITYKLQYVTIPLGLTLKTNEIGYMTYFAQLGIDPQINIKATGDSDSDRLDGDKIKDEVNLFNIGYHVGLGMEYSLGGNTAVVVGIIYKNLFLDITKDYTDQPEDRVILHNIAIRIGLNF
ncbi:MAG: PorT family protein [Bacteroidales bacterium]|nr:MAG: PorT family protein [Bacteroidales bacterium]